MKENRKGMLLVLSGPSGVGKGTLLKTLFEADDSFAFSVSATTRSPRPEERDGVDYHFMSEERFMTLLAEGAFLESAEVHGHRYGTLRTEVAGRIESGLNVVLDIDVQGALQVMEKWPDCVSVFVLPPSFAALRERLTGRGTERPEDIERRLRNARGEVRMAGRYQYQIVNGKVEEAARQLLEIARAEKQRSTRYHPVIEEE